MVRPLQLSGSEFFIFEVLRVNESQHRVPKQKRILAAVKPQCHFIEVGWG
jgi:hypothetical protein